MGGERGEGTCLERKREEQDSRERTENKSTNLSSISEPKQKSGGGERKIPLLHIKSKLQPRPPSTHPRLPLQHFPRNPPIVNNHHRLAQYRDTADRSIAVFVREPVEVLRLGACGGWEVEKVAEEGQAWGSWGEGMEVFGAGEEDFG